MFGFVVIVKDVVAGADAKSASTRDRPALNSKETNRSQISSTLKSEASVYFDSPVLFKSRTIWCLE